MADLYAAVATVTNAGATQVTFGANAGVTATGEFSKFGTRELAFYKVTGYTLNAANLTNVVRGIQTVAELYFTKVDSNTLYVGVASDTNPTTGPAFDTDATPTVLERMKAAIEASAGGTATVAAAAFS